MKESVFVINNRFRVDTDRNEVFDKETALKSRLEPRLMKLLYLLVNHPGNVVKRNFIIREIWDDYPGANESLNQAISFLRKLLADESKEIIQTQPKAGYSFCAIISLEDNAKKEINKKYIPAIIIASALLLLLFFIVDRYLRSSQLIKPGEQFNERNDAEISREDSIHQAANMKNLKDTLGNAAKGDSLRRIDTMRH